MITRFGMSKRFGLAGLATVESQYLEGRMSLNCSDATAAEVDAEIVEILKESYEKALAMLRENRELMDKLAEYLIEKETITGNEFMAIFRKEKGLPDPEEKEGESGAKAEKKSEEGVSADVVEAKEEPANGEKEEAVAEEVAVEKGVNAEAETDAEKKENASDEVKTESEASGQENTPVADGQKIEPEVPGQVAEPKSQKAEGAESATDEAKAESKASEQPAEDNRPVGRISNGKHD